MNSKKLFKGVVVPTTTPFTPEGKVDLAAAERMANYIAEHGLSLFVLGTTGETASIPRTERLKLVQAVVGAIAGRVPVYAGIGDNCLSNSLIAAQRYLDAGVQAVVSHLPSYYPLDEAEMLAYFEELHKGVNGPLLIYNIPVTTHMSMPVEVVKRLADLPRCVGFKDSENVPGRMEEVYLALGGREDFSLFMGSAFLSVKSLELGYDGLVPSSGNVVPDLWRDLYTAALNSNWSQAQTLQLEQDAITILFQQDRTLGQSLAALKAAMHVMGICGPTVLPPLQTMSEAECRIIGEELFTLCPRLKNEQTAYDNRG